MSASLKPPHPITEHVHLYRSETESRDVFRELSVVALLVPAVTFDGEPVEIGETGTIVAVWNGGNAYDVEFSNPVGIASVGRADIRLA